MRFQYSGASCGGGADRAQAEHGIMDETETVAIDRDHHRWLLGPMTKALLSGEPIARPPPRRASP